MSEEKIEKTYYPNGALKAEVPYKNGKRNGITKQYYEDGKLMLEMSLIEDKVSGVMRQYDT